MKEKVEEASAQFKKVFLSASLKEMFNNIPITFTELLIFIFLAMFMLLPLRRLIINVLGLQSFYSSDVNVIHSVAVCLTLIAVIIIFVKHRLERRHRLSRSWVWDLLLKEERKNKKYLSKRNRFLESTQIDAL
ncbi:MAG: hypothetical protein NC320_10070 [Clostridium sp.]|nr:hypothetical protein [Clostridium sp.]MCM1548033.1 hypothetical protein [Ruminococcus sp.]